MISLIRSFSGTELLIVLVAFVLAILFALTIHEFSHSLIALSQGDYTSRNFGRLSLNPLNHIDPIGFLCLVLFGFGWAKPVPINSLKFKNYRLGLFLVSISGVTANFICCFIFVGLLVLIFNGIFITITSYSYLMQFLYYLLYFSASINLGLAIFNLLPIPPLDGFNIVSSFSKGTSQFVEILKRYGFLILIILLIFNVIDLLLGVIYSFVFPAFVDFWKFIF